MSRSHPFFQAVQIMTVVPTPSSTRIDGDWLASAKYFPLVGALVGLVCAGVLIAASYVWSSAVAAILAVGTGVVLTGAIHEDGISDTADGLFGGRTREKRLAIIKDSRIGTYGAVALLFTLALRVAIIASLPALMGAAALVAAHALGRAGVAAAMSTIPYGGNVETAKLNYPQRRISATEALVALLFTGIGMIWLALLAPLAASVGVAAAIALALLPPFAAQRLIGGYTGDILGATEQMAQIGLLLGAAALA